MTKREGALEGTDDTVAAADSERTPLGLERTEMPGPAAGGTRAAAALATMDGERYGERTLINEGGMGRIVSVLDRQLGRRVALKELRFDTPELRARFEREALLTARLEHPSIVSVHEAGRWSNGEPVYAMRLVAGRPFDKVIAAATTLSARLALLPHVLAIADAVAYAHDQRVIHRDLKPANVLVGDFGETVVIDWGLAKEMGAPGEPTRSINRLRLPSSPGGGSDETSAGEVMGTPAFMPPEQAEGRTVDERADVYAIGAILYDALSGRPPYSGASGREVIEAVRTRAPTPLAELQRGVPPDLLAIVERAMARDPGERFPTARELAAELRRFQSGQLVASHEYSFGQLLARWVRRNRAAVAVGAIALTLLAAVGVVSVRGILRAERRADAQRKVAEQRRADAEDLVDFMVNDLHDGLHSLGKLGLLDAVTQKALAYYAKRPPSRDPDEMAGRIRTTQLLADVLHEKGDEDAAIAQLRAALAMAEELARLDPTRRDGLAPFHMRIGEALFAKSDLDGALAEYRSAEKVTLELLEQPNPHREWHEDLHGTKLRIGDVYAARGDYATARPEFESALEIARKLVRSKPDDDEAQRRVSIDLQRIADTRGFQGDREGALAALREAVEVAEKRAARAPDNPLVGRDLLIARVALADGLQARGDVAGAITTYREGLAGALERSMKEPSNADWQRDVAVMHNKLGDALLVTQDYAGAIENHRAALALRQSRVAETPDDAEAQADMASSQVSVGDAFLATNDPRAALASYRDAIASVTRALAIAPEGLIQIYIADTAHWGAGEASLALGDRATALAEYKAALALAEKLAATDPTNTDFKATVDARRAKVAELQPPAP